MAEHQARNIKAIAPAARAAKLSIKLTKAGLGSKKPKAQKTIEGKANAGELAKQAIQRQIAKLKNMGMTEKEIRTMFGAMIKETT